MSNDTIRKHLIDAINEMSKLLELSTDSNQKFELRIKIRELFHRLDRVIIASLNPATAEFNDAIESLKELTNQAKEAQVNLGKTIGIINKATKAIQKVEKLVKNIAGVMGSEVTDSGIWQKTFFSAICKITS
ncbi:MAG: hypothetical protein OFPII_40740 [Osedax symbiont Rs1]|nr:MAG: hypothetical protein OFPII_40740 [Osedax symbiont Rs1]